MTTGQYGIYLTDGNCWSVLKTEVSICTKTRHYAMFDYLYQ